MGTSYGTICKSCGNEEEYMLGCGFMSNRSFEHLHENTSSKILKRHLNLLEKEYQGMVIDIPILKLYECSQCKTIHSRLKFAVEYGENEVFNPQYNCGKCKSILMPIELVGSSFGSQMEPTGYKCKKCGKESL